MPSYAMDFEGWRQLNLYFYLYQCKLKFTLGYHFWNDVFIANTDEKSKENLPQVQVFDGKKEKRGRQMEEKTKEEA